MSNHLRAQQLCDVGDPIILTTKFASTQKSASDTMRETRAAEKAAVAAVATSTDDVLRAVKALNLIESHIVLVTRRGGAGFHFVTPPLLRPRVNSWPFHPAPYDTGPWAGYGAGRVFYFPR